MKRWMELWQRDIHATFVGACTDTLTRNRE